jgi:DNA-binding MarR family transcriptional regulator
MDALKLPPADLRRFRNSKLYRPLARVLRVYNRRLTTELNARGFPEFSSAFPQILSNLDTEGTRVGVLAARAGMSRQAAGQLIAEIERCGFVERTQAPYDARAIVVRYTPRGRKLLASVLAVVEAIESEWATVVGVESFDQMRVTLGRIADEADPGGALGQKDEQPPGDQARLRRARRARR